MKISNIMMTKKRKGDAEKKFKEDLERDLRRQIDKEEGIHITNPGDKSGAAQRPDGALLSDRIQ